MSTPSLAPIALQPDRDGVLRTAAELAREVCSGDSVFLAVRDPEGRYPMSVRVGLRDPQWDRVTIRRGRGVGGQILDDQRARTSDDYLRDPSITADYVPIMRREQLRGLAVAPVPDLVASRDTGATADAAAPRALLYLSTHHAGAPGDRVVHELQRIAEMAAVGLAHLPETANHADAGVLTARELDVLRLLGEGCSNRLIAERLVIAEPTAKGHVRAILRKLDVPSRLAAVAAGRERGLL